MYEKAFVVWNEFVSFGSRFHKLDREKTNHAQKTVCSGIYWNRYRGHMLLHATANHHIDSDRFIHLSGLVGLFTVACTGDICLGDCARLVVESLKKLHEHLYRRHISRVT